MAARPPGGGNTAEPEAIEFGIASLDARLDDADVSFPATNAEIHEALGDQEIPYDAAGRTIALKTVLERVPNQEFANETVFLDAVYPIFDEARQQRGGFLSGLRDLFPF